MRYITTLILILTFSLLLPTQQAQAGAKHLFKIASLAPEGSVWIRQFEEFTKEVSEKTGGEVGFRVYPGGIMGDDLAMYRKMRVGQLHGGGFTMTGISAVVSDFSVMTIPFLFKSYAEVDTVKDALFPLFHKRFSDKGMELIALTEVGFLYAMSTSPISTIDELKKTTIWAPAGDTVATTFLSSLDVSAVQLSIPDVLSSLQTGLVDTVFNSLYGSIVMQWFTKARYVTDTPFGYAYGAFLLDRKKFQKLPPEYAEIIHVAAVKHFAVLMDETRKSNTESRQVMEERGVQFISVDKETVRELESHRDRTIKQLVDKSFSREVYDTTINILQQHRTSQPTGESK